MEIRSSENVLLSVSVAASLCFWGWTWWKNREDQKLMGSSGRFNPVVYHQARSPGSPRTRGAFKKRGCTCKLINTKDDCLQNKQKNKWNGSDEEEIDTDANLIPSSMRSTRHVMLNR
ncbi:hypothetical protein L5515_004932 [Caenorhabditis briggsae]|uniref:Uncharacterized protein n=1 Tax=Caenorhabditis briggsae TaxID=6238 RepID=A0AAE9EMV1_CAEBR|nr:hypothetical protein L5515_004932 [Caenorhabditis briggsae]